MGPRPLELLEREITSLASQIHAATCRWLELVAEYDAREGWAQWGCRSCAHWVSWRCGIAPGPAREHVRVARRLRQLPLIRAAFGEGELSFSKVRALTRLNNVEREQDLLDLARHATASQLERLLRAYRGVVAAEAMASGGRPDRWLRIEHDDDRSVLVRGRFPAEEGALIVAALEAAQDELARRDVPAETRELTSRDEAAETPELADQTGCDVPAETPARSPSAARADALLPSRTLISRAPGAAAPAATATRCSSTWIMPRSPRTSRPAAANSRTARRWPPRPHGGWRVTPPS
jgi:hypothetical protein